MEVIDGVSFAEIVANMIYLSWHTVNDFKVSLGVQDKIARAMMSAVKEGEASLANLKNEDEIKTFFKALYQSNNKNLRELTRYVPHLFLEPFVTKELSLFKEKNKDNKRREEIKRLAHLAFDSSSPIFYKIEGKQELIIHPIWQEYLLKNIRVVEDFTYWNLVQYLQSRNPNVPNISQKVLPPNPKRSSLSNARKIWQLVLESQDYHCIYYNQSISSNAPFALDHFIPWSFVTHDMIWNLIPIPQVVNSSKSNKLPKLDLSFEGFAKVQYNVFHELVKLRKTKALEDYVLLFKENTNAISTMSAHDFCQGLHARISPLIDIVANSGFEKNWIYKPKL